MIECGKIISEFNAVLPPGHRHCAGRHQFSGRHHRQVADVHQQIQARHHGDGDDNRPGQIHLEGKKRQRRYTKICII